MLTKNEAKIILTSTSHEANPSARGVINKLKDAIQTKDSSTTSIFTFDDSVNVVSHTIVLDVCHISQAYFGMLCKRKSCEAMSRSDKIIRIKT